jgi:hypothetical protein
MIFSKLIFKNQFIHYTCKEYKKIQYIKYIMRVLHYIFFISSIHLSHMYFIQNQNKKICANCKFFIKNNNECSKFGEVNIVTGKHLYEIAENVRNDENKCGEDAIFFTKNYFKFMTFSYYFILEHWVFISLFILYTIPIVFFLSLFHY